MELDKPRLNFNDQIRNTLHLCQYKEIPIKLVGSSSLQSQQFFGDYDGLTIIQKNDTPEQIFDEFNKIIDKINNDPNLYFIELKIQDKNENKKKYYKNNKLDLATIKKFYDNMDFIKIDLSMWHDYQFVDVSIIYSNNDTPIKKDDIKNSIDGDIKDLEKDGKYYKVLKRKFSIYKLDDNYKKMSELTKIFNSDLGLKYKLASNLEAMDLVHQHYKDKLTNQRIKINLEFLKLYDYNINDLMNYAKKLKDEINSEAKKFNNKFKI